MVYRTVYFGIFKMIFICLGSRAFLNNNNIYVWGTEIYFILLFHTESVKEDAVHPCPLESYHVRFYESRAGVPIPIGEMYHAYRDNDFIIGLVLLAKGKMFPLLDSENRRIKENVKDHHQYNLTEDENREFLFFKWFIDMTHVFQVVNLEIR